MFDSTPDTITIQLTQDQVAVIDAIDADILQFRWYAQFIPAYGNGGNFVAMRSWWTGSRNYTEAMHRTIMSQILGRPLLRSEEVDHRDLNPLNNRRENLRLATRGQNQMNRGLRKDNKTGFKGVRLSPNNKYRATIYANHKCYNLGTFATPEEAHEAYCQAAKELHGEFANFG